MPITATVAAGLVVPLILGGELRGRLFEGNCSEPGAEVRLGSLRDLAYSDVSPIVVSTGDILGPEPLSGYALKGPSSVQTDLLSILRRERNRPVFDAVLPGNYELSARPRTLRHLGTEVLPWTIANADLSAPFRRHRVVVRRRARIGLTAVLDENLTYSINPNRKREIRNSARALQKASAVLRKAGVHAVVALIHVGRGVGLSRIVEILESMEGRAPDVVLTSPLAGDPSIVRLGGLRTVVIPAPRRPSKAALVELVFGDENRIRDIQATRRAVVAAPSASADIVRNWVCSRLDIPLDVEPESLEISKEAFIRFTLERMRRLTGAEIALVNTGSFGPDRRFPLKPSPTELDIRRALPFEDRLEIAEIRGADLGPIEALALDPRVSSVGILDGAVAGRLPDPLRKYRVVTLDFVAAGGDELLEPGTYDFKPVERVSSLRSAIIRTLKRQGFDTDADPDPDHRVSEPTLIDGRINLGASLKSVSVENRVPANGAQLEAPQLARENFLGISGDLELRLSLDLPDHRFELIERTRYGVIREATEPDGEPEAVENEDVTTVELTYAGRLSGEADEPWVPDAGATAQLETELTVPEERDYRRALLQLGVGPIWTLTGNLSFRSQLGIRQELFASTSNDPAERLLGETRVALLSSAALRDETFEGYQDRRVIFNARVDHAVDFTGRVRDQVLQGRVAIDVPVFEGIALTAAVDVYFLARSRIVGDPPGMDGSPPEIPGSPPVSGGAVDTSFGIKSTADFSRALY